MYFYKFAKIYMGIDYNMVDFAPFQIDERNVDLSECIIVKFSNKMQQKENWSKSFHNCHINIYSVEDGPVRGWVIEDALHRGLMEVSHDYKSVTFSCTYETTNSEYYETLKYLLLFVIQCRMVYVGMLILHSACIQVNNNAICFSGPSGIGKSTRAELWIENKGAAWISGDRPAIDPEFGIVYGVPWDGKEQIHVPEQYPILAILEVNRSTDTYVQEFTKIQRYDFLCKQLFIPMWDSRLRASVFAGIDQLIRNVKMIRLYSDITEESIEVQYRLLFGKETSK